VVSIAAFQIMDEDTKIKRRGEFPVVFLGDGIVAETTLVCRVQCPNHAICR
jgi:hypothetical protein